MRRKQNGKKTKQTKAEIKTLHSRRSTERKKKKSQESTGQGKKRILNKRLVTKDSFLFLSYPTAKTIPRVRLHCNPNPTAFHTIHQRGRSSGRTLFISPYFPLSFVVSYAWINRDWPSSACENAYPLCFRMRCTCRTLRIAFWNCSIRGL